MKPYADRLEETARDLGRKLSQLETHYHHAGYIRVRKRAYVDPHQYSRWAALSRELERVGARLRQVRGETHDNDSD